MKKQPLKVGLDLDGVVLYNPARIARPAVVALKKLFLKRRVSTFYVPHKPMEQRLWRLFHKSSIFVAPGLADFKRLSQEGKIELYIVTARYSFLWPELESWLERIDAKSFVKGVFYNQFDEQPHLFKEKTLKKLKLDVFVEDNWDVVKYLAPHLTITQIYWIYNILDRRIPYPLKYPDLKKVADIIAAALD